MKFYRCISKAKALTAWAAVLSALAMLFIFSEECKTGCVNGILLCLGILVPSLFPFFILSSFIAESSLCEYLSLPFGKMFTIITGMEKNAFIPVIMSIVGGYPVGAKTIAQMYRNSKLTKESAGKLSALCCLAGPGFLVTFVGVSLMKSKEAGLILLSSQIIGIFVLLIMSRFLFNKNSIKEFTDNRICKRATFFEVMISSVSSSVKSTAGMCGFVIFFSAVCEITKTFPFMTGNLRAIVMSLLEITTGLTATDSYLSIETISALAGFGGICVHMQIFRELKGIEFSRTKFYICRIIQTAISFVSAKILLLIFPISTPVFSTFTEKPQVIFYSNIGGCLILFITSILFIFSIRKKHQY